MIEPYAVAGIVSIIFITLLCNSQSDLFEIAGTSGATGVFPYSLENGKEDSCQDRDNGYHDKQFDQSEAAFGLR